MNDFLSFTYSSADVRLFLIDDAPWFVAADVAAILGYDHAPNMVRQLDDDEKGVHNVPTPGGRQEMTVISESGLYNAIFKSRRDEARAFRRWITGEVLPAIRRTGTYALAPVAAEPPAPRLDDLDAPRLSACVALVREARRLYGQHGARMIWSQLGLPVPAAVALGDALPADRAAALEEWLAGRGQCMAVEAATAIGLNPAHSGDVNRVARQLRALGWASAKVRDGRAVRNRWHAPVLQTMGG